MLSVIKDDAGFLSLPIHTHTQDQYMESLASEARRSKEDFQLSLHGSHGQAQDENLTRLESCSDFLDLTPCTKVNLGIVEDHPVYHLGCCSESGPSERNSRRQKEEWERGPI